MRSSIVVADTDATAAQYNNLREDAKAAGTLLAHEQSSPNMTLYVEAGSYYFDNVKVTYAGGNSPTFTAPVSNNRIDLLCISSAGVLSVVTGVAGASPAVPTYPADKIVICEVYLRSTSTTLRDSDGGAATGYIQKDVRPYLYKILASGGLDNATFTYDSLGRISTVVDSATSKTYTLTYTGDRVTSVTDGTYTWTITYNTYLQVTAISKA